jgi:hypothetical protein
MLHNINATDLKHRSMTMILEQWPTMAIGPGAHRWKIRIFVVDPLKNVRSNLIGVDMGSFPLERKKFCIPVRLPL